ncbi:MAG TPA: hypothetical protein VG756_01840 [Pseudonocardiaceae bacterium]|jgi:hypothetical protein|nr:hypothetical protein [Pseudonocardiaceae bacterium]
MTITDVMAEFARTAAIGELRIGLTGPPLIHALNEIGVSVDPADTPDFDDEVGSLEVHLRGGELIQLGMDNLGDFTFEFPGDPDRISFTMNEFLAVLADRHCRYGPDTALTYEGQQRAIRTAAGVSITFVPDESAAGEYRLHSLYSTAR